MGKNFISGESYKKILESIPICTVDIIFLNSKKDKILLCKRNNEPAKDLYYTNGGRWYKGEKLLDCAVRQAKKEMGIDIDPEKTIFCGIIEEHWETSAFGTTQDNLDVFYAYILENEDVKIDFDGQHSNYKWFDIDDSTLHPNILERIRQTLLALKK